MPKARAAFTNAFMQIRLLAFAQAADRLGFRECLVECTPDDSARSILARIAPDFEITALRAAVDHEYRPWDAAIGEAREIALIPPVSGG